MKSTKPSSERKRSKTKSEEACPGCGMARADWPETGYTYDERRYCCQGCAEGTGCTCAEEDLGSMSA